jgi:hypothetical protein
LPNSMKHTFIPSTTNLQINHLQEAAQGAVQAEAVQGAVQAEAAQGAVQAEAAQGAVQAEAAQGAVQAEAAQGAVQAEAAQGAVGAGAGGGGAESGAPGYDPSGFPGAAGAACASIQRPLSHRKKCAFDLPKSGLCLRDGD